jgi:hypothetical protein
MENQADRIRTGGGGINSILGPGDSAEFDSSAMHANILGGGHGK